MIDSHCTALLRGIEGGKKHGDLRSTRDAILATRLYGFAPHHTVLVSYRWSGRLQYAADAVPVQYRTVFTLAIRYLRQPRIGLVRQVNRIVHTS